MLTLVWKTGAHSPDGSADAREQGCVFASHLGENVWDFHCGGSQTKGQVAVHASSGLSVGHRALKLHGLLHAHTVDEGQEEHGQVEGTCKSEALKI